MIGSTVGSYRITKLLGEGGMGAVYQATDNIEREVAIKALRPQLIHDADRLQRFRSEAIALGRLHHPNITSLFQLLEENDTFYLVMEFVDGHTLEELIYQHGALPPRLALELLIDALHGFEHAHARGVIHRDIKASNLMVSAVGATKIMDFGIARIEGAARLTQTGKPLGTLEYMSPEQVRGLEQDARSDIYSLGVLLFELLTGRVPFTADSDFELMRAHLEKAPPSVLFLVPSLPPALDAVLARALAKEPQARFETVVELRMELEAIASGLPVTSSSAALVTSSNALPLRATNLSASIPRSGTMPLEDRYATRQQGTPFTATAVPVAGSVVSTVPASALNSPAANPKQVVPKATFAAQRLPTFVGLGGISILVAGFLAWGMMRPSPHNRVSAPQTVTSQVPLKQLRAVTRSVEPKRVGVIAEKQQPRPRTRSQTRRTKRRVRWIEKPNSRPIKSSVPVRAHVVRGASFRRAPQIRGIKLVRRFPHPANSGGEKAALRAIIKGQ